MLTDKKSGWEIESNWACLIDTCEYSDGYPEAQWGYLRKGVMINFPLNGLIHYEEPESDIRQLLARNPKDRIELKCSALYGFTFRRRRPAVPIDAARIYWMDDLPVAVVAAVATSPVIYDVHTAHLGRPVAMTNASEGIAWSAIYQPFLA